MKRSLYLTILCASIILLSQATMLAQGKKKINPEWLAADIVAVQLIHQIMPLEQQSVDHIKSVLNDDTIYNETDLGFGAKGFRITKKNGYTSLDIEGFSFDSEIGYYKISVISDRENWQKVRTEIIEAWKSQVGPNYKEAEYGMMSVPIFNRVYKSYQAAVGAELGEMQPAQVPLHLKTSYDYLTSLLNDSYVGKLCGYAGAPPAGKLAIDALVNAGRIDLIENVLRGYSPVGRIYAAIALLEMKERGFALSAQTQSTLDKVINLPILVSACSGCIIFSGQTTKEAIRIYNKE